MQVFHHLRTSKLSSPNWTELNNFINVSRLQSKHLANRHEGSDKEYEA